MSVYSGSASLFVARLEGEGDTMEKGPAALLPTDSNIVGTRVNCMRSGPFPFLISSLC